MNKKLIKRSKWVLREKKSHLRIEKNGKTSPVKTDFFKGFVLKCVFKVLQGNHFVL